MAVILEWLNYIRHSKIQLESQGEVEVIGASWEYSHVIYGHTVIPLPDSGPAQNTETYIVEDESRLEGKTELCSEFEMNGLYSTASEVSGSCGAGLWLPVSLATRAGAVVPMRLRTAGRG